MADCIFCKIVNKEIDADILYEDEHSLAFLDISPASKGHTLVIPKKHFRTLEEVPDEILEKTFLTVKKVAKSVKKFSEGYNVSQNNEKLAGQVVFHVHFHIVPRRENDGLKIGWGETVEYDEGEKEEYIKKIKENLS